MFETERKKTRSLENKLSLKQVIKKERHICIFQCFRVDKLSRLVICVKGNLTKCLSKCE